MGILEVKAMKPILMHNLKKHVHQLKDVFCFFFVPKKVTFDNFTVISRTLLILEIFAACFFVLHVNQYSNFFSSALLPLIEQDYNVANFACFKGIYCTFYGCKGCPHNRSLEDAVSKNRRSKEAVSSPLTSYFLSR